MKKKLFVLAAVAALGGVGIWGTFVSAQSGVQPAAAGSQPTLKIGLVNMVKVLKKFDKANYLGEVLLKEAQKEEENLKNKQTQLAADEARYNSEADPARRDEGTKAIAKRKFELSEIVMAHRKKFQDKQGEMAVEVNDNISKVIDILAKTKGLELVLAYPEAVEEKDKNTPPAAFQRLAPPAVIVAWGHPGLDITDAVIATLNYNFKAPAGTVPAGGTGGATPPPRP